MLVPRTNLPPKQVTTLMPRVKAEAMDEPMRIMGPSGPEISEADTVTIVPNSLTNTVLHEEALAADEGQVRMRHDSMYDYARRKQQQQQQEIAHLKRNRLGTWMPLR
jgi:hypothetical protein